MDNTVLNLQDYKGLVCHHKATESFMIVQSATICNESLLLNCLVRVKEEKEIYFANASYSLNEVILTDVYIQDEIRKRQEIIGVQLELF